MSPRVRLLVQAAAVVAVVGLAFFGLARVLDGGSPARRVDAVPQDQPGPVLLVPGYGGATGSLEVLAARLRAAGRQAQVVALPAGGTGDLRQAARALDTAAHQLLDAGAPSVDVIGYSAGGVVARIWAKDLGGAHFARRIVTLGSPHHGTKVAALAATFAASSCPMACRQLVPGSDLLRLLDEGDPTPDGPVWMSVWTDQDETVTPPDSARLDGAVDVVLQRICPEVAVSHADLPRSSLVGGVVLAALGKDALRPPAKEDCARLST